MRKSFDMSDERLSVVPPPASGKAENGPAPRRVKIGLALGAGAARGWAHIGVLRELEERGIFPDVIAGTSIGAVVGGCYAAGKLDQIEAFARSLTKRRVFALMDLSFSGMSLISGERLKTSLEHEVGGLLIEKLPIPFAAVATEVGTGHEIWLQRGALDLAIRASYALPGIFEPVRVGDRYLFDGALVNPVPVTVCRALGAEYVIAINMASDMMYRSKVVADQLAAATAGAPAEGPFGGRGSAALEVGLLPRFFERSAAGSAPNVASAMVDAFNIVQDRILRSRLAGDPPDAIVNARGDEIGMFDFHRAEQAIAMGRDAAKRALPTIFSHIPAAALSS
ncbi:NTE family protein rssA [Methylocystis bryophila]|uniref:NTE family protein rssA n=2 Tax=Methylocystis bryophila TaxID=655015 RepID=A0A1W6N1V0_9HYPH|nr:NTE family protein rssA [Methylocystis bryophila]